MEKVEEGIFELDFIKVSLNSVLANFFIGCRFYFEGQEDYGDVNVEVGLKDKVVHFYAIMFYEPFDFELNEEKKEAENYGY